MLVEVWSDVVCPWCYIGKRRFEEALAELAADPTFDRTSTIVYRPFQLDPTAPPGTTMPVAEAYARKFGGPEPAIAIIEHVTGIAAEAGLDFHLDLAQRANTRDAHRMLEYAARPTAPRGPRAMQGAPARRLLRGWPRRRRPRRARRLAAAAGLDGRRRAALAGRDEGLPSSRRRCRRRRGRDHRRTDVRHRRAVVDPRRPGSRRLRPGVGQVASNVPERLATTSGSGRGWSSSTGSPRRPVVGTDGRPARRALPGRRGRRARPRRVRRHRRRLRWRGAELLGAAGGEATYVGYSMGGRLCLHLALARPDLVARLVLITRRPGSRTPTSEPARRAADDALATAIEEDGVDAFLDRWLDQPLFATLRQQPGPTTGDGTAPRAWRRACDCPAPARRRRCGTACRR